MAEAIKPKGPDPLSMGWQTGRDYAAAVGYYTMPWSTGFSMARRVTEAA